MLGILLLPVALLLTAVSFALILQFAPPLRNVPVNPLEALIASPMAIAWVARVAVVAGGIREEIQRAFILHRFEQRLGGAVVGCRVGGSGHTQPSQLYPFSRKKVHVKLGFSAIHWSQFLPSCMAGQSCVGAGVGASVGGSVHDREREIQISVTIKGKKHAPL